MANQGLQGLPDPQDQLCLWMAEAHRLLASQGLRGPLEHRVFLDTLQG